MSSNELTRIEFTNEQNDNAVNALGSTATELEPRITPLVVIAIIAVLIGLLLPAVW